LELLHSKSVVSTCCPALHQSIRSCRLHATHVSGAVGCMPRMYQELQVACQFLHGTA
jgi:hypothetical protein